MKQLKSLLVFTLLLTSTITAMANDYALLNTYPLLKDMKQVKEEQKILKNIHELITNKTFNQEALRQEEQKFNTLMQGLKSGDTKMGLKGTELDLIVHQITRVEQVWQQEKRVLNAALKNDIYTNQALNTLNKITEELTKLYALYHQSYTRYKKNSVMKSLVKSYMRTHAQPKQLYAVNTLNN